jgi:hypothetical protein
MRFPPPEPPPAETTGRGTLSRVGRSVAIGRILIGAVSVGGRLCLGRLAEARVILHNSRCSIPNDLAPRWCRPARGFLFDDACNAPRRPRGRLGCVFASSGTYWRPLQHVVSATASAVVPMASALGERTWQAARLMRASPGICPSRPSLDPHQLGGGRAVAILDPFWTRPLRKSLSL